MRQRVLVLISWQPEHGETARKYQSHALSSQEVIVRRLDTFYAACQKGELVIEDARQEIDPLSFDVVHFAGWQFDSEMALLFAYWLDQHKVPFVGHTLLHTTLNSKIDEMAGLVRAGVPYPDTYFALRGAQLPALYAWAHQQYGLAFPVVVKATAASKGEHNFLVHSAEELKSLPLEEGLRYTIQPYIPNSCDYRVLVLGGEVQLVIRRTRQDAASHLNNTSQGAHADVVDPHTLPSDFIPTAEAAAKALRRADIAGVDLLIDEVTNKVCVLEVNKTPHMALGGESVIAPKLTALFSYLDVFGNHRQ